MAQSPGVDGIIQVAISVEELDRAVAFYRDVLGLPFMMQAGPNLAFLHAGSTRLMLAVRGSQSEPESHPILYYRVPDIHLAVAALRERGGAIKEEPHLIARLEKADVWLAAGEDPDGHLVGLMCEVPRA